MANRRCDSQSCCSTSSVTCSIFLFRDEPRTLCSEQKNPVGPITFHRHGLEGWRRAASSAP